MLGSLLWHWLVLPLMSSKEKYLQKTKACYYPDTWVPHCFRHLLNYSGVGEQVETPKTIATDFLPNFP